MLPFNIVQFKNHYEYIVSSAVKWSIAINCIQNKSFCLHNIDSPATLLGTPVQLLGNTNC